MITVSFAPYIDASIHGSKSIFRGFGGEMVATVPLSGIDWLLSFSVLCVYC